MAWTFLELMMKTVIPWRPLTVVDMGDQSLHLEGGLLLQEALPVVSQPQPNMTTMRTLTVASGIAIVLIFFFILFIDNVS